MITPSLDTRALVVALDAISDAVRAAVRIASVPPAMLLRRHRLRSRRRTLYRGGRRGLAEGAVALQPARRRRVPRASSASSAMSGSPFLSAPDIRSAIDAALQQVLDR